MYNIDKNTRRKMHSFGLMSWASIMSWLLLVPAGMLLLSSFLAWIFTDPSGLPLKGVLAAGIMGCIWFAVELVLIVLILIKIGKWIKEDNVLAWRLKIAITFGIVLAMFIAVGIIIFVYSSKYLIAIMILSVFIIAGSIVLAKFVGNCKDVVTFNLSRQ